MIFFSFFAAAILAPSAYLQSESNWWKGPLAALALVGVGYAVLLFLSPEQLENTILPPVIGLAAAAWICAALIGAGALFALLLRGVWTSGRIAGAGFFGGWIIIVALQKTLI